MLQNSGFALRNLLPTFDLEGANGVGLADHRIGAHRFWWPTSATEHSGMLPCHEILHRHSQFDYVGPVIRNGWQWLRAAQRVQCGAIEHGEA